jgi:hypothetical protein
VNVSDVVLRVRRTFGDESSIQLQDADIIRWINDAQEQIAVDNEGVMETTGVADIVNNQKIYTLPSDLSVLRSLSFNGFHLKPLNLNVFNQTVDGYQSPDNNNATGNPEFFTVWNNEVWLYPVPDADLSQGLTIYYIAHPPTVSTLADGIAIPVQYHNAIVEYCLSQAYELDENFEGQDRKKQSYEQSLMKLNDRNKWLAQETYPTITTLPEDENYGDLGSGFVGGS